MRKVDVDNHLCKVPTYTVEFEDEEYDLITKTLTEYYIRLQDDWMEASNNENFSKMRQISSTMEDIINLRNKIQSVPRN